MTGRFGGRGGTASCGRTETVTRRRKHHRSAHCLLPGAAQCYERSGIGPLRGAGPPISPKHPAAGAGQTILRYRKDYHGWDPVIWRKREFGKKRGRRDFSLATGDNEAVIELEYRRCVVDSLCCGYCCAR